MKKQSTRRDFLKLSALGLAAGAAAEISPAWQGRTMNVAAGVAGPAGEIELWVTNPSCDVPEPRISHGGRPRTAL